MTKYLIEGGHPLHGTIEISGAKNAAVAIIPAALLVDGVCRIENVPQISDVTLILQILRELGADVRTINRTTVEIDCSHIRNRQVPYELARKIRASYYLVGALLGRFGWAEVPLPGGCNLGGRPIDQHIKGFVAMGADVEVKGGYVHASSGQRLSGSETRNINRSYPGRTDGTFTEKMSYGVTQLIEQEGIDITVDLHEASPEYPTINTIVAHQDALSLGSQALINMQLEGMSIGLEPSPENLHGLTHRELGDYTDTLALLMETSNPSQGRLRGKTDENLVVTGQDKYYLKAAGYGRLYDFGYDADGAPISERVARHVAGVAQFAVAFNELGLGNLVINGIPSYVDMAADIGQFLAPD